MKLLKEFVSYDDLQLISEDVGDTGNKNYYLKGPFLQANVKNRNGRKYMRETLEREVKSFNESKIKTNRSIGELDHPECSLSNDFSVLTYNGWTQFTDLNVGDLVLSINSDNIMEYNPIERIIDAPYTGIGYTIKSDNIDSAFTPTHRMFIENISGVREYATIEQIYNNRSIYNKYKIVKTADCGNINNFISLDIDLLRIEPIQHDGNVYCLTVKNSNFCMKQNNKCFWTGNSPSINLDRISHIITELSMDGDIGYGCAKLLDTPMGKIAISLVSNGVQLGMSTRGVGTLEGDLVKDDYTLITVDIVADPSAPTAFVEGVLENKEYIITNTGDIVEAAVNQLKKNVDKAIVNNRYNKKEFSKEVLNYLDLFMNSIK